MEQNLKTGGLNDSLTRSTRLLNQKLGTSPELTRPTPSEIALLLQIKKELAEQALATITRASTRKIVAAAM